MQEDQIRAAMLRKSRAAKIEQRGRAISFACIALIVLVVIAIFYFVASKGLATFYHNGVNVWEFLSKKSWSPSTIGPHGKPEVGALPMIVAVSA